MARKYTVLLPSFHLEARIPLVLEFQPSWKKMRVRQIGSTFPQFSGWKFNKYLSCHHLVLILKTPFLVTPAFWWMWSPISNLLMWSCATRSRRFLGSIDVVRERLFEWKFVKPSAHPASRTYQNIFQKWKDMIFSECSPKNLIHIWRFPWDSRFFFLAMSRLRSANRPTKTPEEGISICAKLKWLMTDPYSQRMQVNSQQWDYLHTTLLWTNTVNPTETKPGTVSGRLSSLSTIDFWAVTWQDTQEFQGCFFNAL